MLNKSNHKKKWWCIQYTCTKHMIALTYGTLTDKSITGAAGTAAATSAEGDLTIGPTHFRFWLRCRNNSVSRSCWWRCCISFISFMCTDVSGFEAGVWACGWSGSRLGTSAASGCNIDLLLVGGVGILEAVVNGMAEGNCDGALQATEGWWCCCKRLVPVPSATNLTRLRCGLRSSMSIFTPVVCLK